VGAGIRANELCITIIMLCVGLFMLYVRMYLCVCVCVW